MRRCADVWSPETLDTVGTRSARDPLRFPHDLDLDLDLVYEIFKVKVKTSTSFFSGTNSTTTLPFDQDVVLDDPYRSPEGQGRDPHRGARNPLEILIFKRQFLGNGKIDFFLFRVCCCTGGPLPNGKVPWSWNILSLDILCWKIRDFFVRSRISRDRWGQRDWYSVAGRENGQR